MNDSLAKVISKGNEVIFGKEQVIKCLLACMIADGHALVEDVPGVGKTTLIKFLAQAFGMDFARIQCTSDLLPSDIIGVSIYHKERESFDFHRGPLFAQMLLVDELNRASPKTQSALLQAMEEKFVSIDGENYQLPHPFLVMATQNPREQVGTYPLPESQLDRFLMKLEMGLPPREQELLLLKNKTLKEQQWQAVTHWENLVQWQQMAQQIHVSDYLYQYVLDLLEFTRTDQGMRPLGPRAGLDMMRAVRAWCVVEDRSEVLPDDIQFMTRYVWSHRLPLQEYASRSEELEMSRRLVTSVAIP